MLITVYTCGTAATGDKVRAWVTVLLLLALMECPDIGCGAL